MSSGARRWSYSAGKRGRNRIRAFEHPKTGRIFLEMRENGARRRIALGHRDRGAAKKVADEVAGALRREDPQFTPAATLHVLFDEYLREVTPQKGDSKRRHDHRAARLFLRLLGSHRNAITLNRRDWDHYIAWRRSVGDLRAGRAAGKPVRNRVIASDLKLLRSVLSWAVSVTDSQGRPLLERNPLHGLRYPVEESPQRPIVTHAMYRAMLAVSARVDPGFELALILANETGHRIGAIRMLRWPDIDLAGESVRWRASGDKIGFEHSTPISPDLLDALQRRRNACPPAGDGWLLASPVNRNEPCSRHLLRDWWQRAEALAGIPHQPGLGWHSLRRKFATELKHIPLKDLCHLGGWKEPQTILKCYQRADVATMREALAGRKRLL